MTLPPVICGACNAEFYGSAAVTEATAHIEKEHADVADEGSSTNGSAKAQAKSKLAHIPTDNTSELEDILWQLQDYYNTVFNAVLPPKSAMSREKALKALQAYTSKKVREGKYEVLGDLLEWYEQWANTHEEAFNWYGAVKAMLVMKDPQKPFAQLTEGKERKE